MTKYVVISSTDNSDYLFYVPLVTWAWNRLGWGVVLFLPRANNRINFIILKCYQAISNNNFRVVNIPEINGYRSETLSQISRLYAANILGDENIIMTSDADMLPLSDYWNPSASNITCYGRDLSDKHYPICYIAMTGSNWKQVMNLTGDTYGDIKRDLDGMPKALSGIKDEWWQIDQDHITEKLNQQSVLRIDRRVAPNSHFPLGRIDRGAWDTTLQQPLRIDAHLLRNGQSEENYQRIIDLINSCLDPSGIELEWIKKYRDEYINTK